MKLVQVILALFTFIFGLTVINCEDGIGLKSCNQIGFCFRNKCLAKNIEKNKGNVSRYSIDKHSLNFSSDQPLIKGNILKDVPNPGSEIILPFEISLLEHDTFRFKVDEVRSPTHPTYVNSKRFDETPKWAFKSHQLPYKKRGAYEFSEQSDKMNLVYGHDKKYRLEIVYRPFSISLYKNNGLELVVNDRKFLNMEHWRKKEENHLHLANEEVDYDMFTYSDPSLRKQTIPLGPESVGLDVTFRRYKNIYGIPEHSGGFNLEDTIADDMPYRLYNVDHFGYGSCSREPLYGSIPFMLALKPMTSVGMFWINSADTFVDIDKTSSEDDSKTHWMSESGVIDIMIMIGDSPNDIHKAYGSVVGFVQLPQLFALGYHQSRWNYDNEEDLLEIHSLFDEHKIPYDTIWLDIEYTDSRNYFTWNEEKFPSPEKMMKELDYTGRNLVVVVDPHFNEEYIFAKKLLNSLAEVKNAEGKPFVGKCWSGKSHWIDTLNPEAQHLWDKEFLLSENSFLGEDATNVYLWNDMNEPAVFGGVEGSFPKDNIHFGGYEHRCVHNLYGLSYHAATYNSMLKRLESKRRQRPFVLTRSFFAGSQRTAATWTGDNHAKWEYLKSSIPTLLTLNIAGMPFAGSDVGGFVGNPSKELLTRWYQAGIWFPFFRGHSTIDAERREPWVPGKPYSHIIANAIKLRYSLLPIWYSAFYESHTTGTPLLTPLFYCAPHNTETYSVDDQFFLGNSGILVKPVTDESVTEISVMLPDNEIYYDYTNGASTSSYYFKQATTITKKIQLADIPMFLRGGSIIARKSKYRRSTALMKNDPYTLTVAPSASGKAEGFLYVDDGESFDYKNGHKALISFYYDDGKLSAKINSSDYFKQLISNLAIEKIIILNEKVATGYAFALQGEKTRNLTTYLENGNLIIEKPKLQIFSDWKITFESAQSNFSEMFHFQWLGAELNYWLVCNYTVLLIKYITVALVPFILYRAILRFL